MAPFFSDMTVHVTLSVLTHTLCLESDKISMTKSNMNLSHQPGQLIFSDEFDDLDLERWSPELAFSDNADGEFQMYTNTRRTLYAERGHLFIKPYLSTAEYDEHLLLGDIPGMPDLTLEGSWPVEACTNPAYLGCNRRGNYPHSMINPAMSAKIRTVDFFYFQYGRVDIRAKMAGGDWMWPGISLLPRFNAYGGWPASGEIQMVQSRGNRKLVDHKGHSLGTDLMTSGLHFGPYVPFDGYHATEVEHHNDAGFDREFHLYSVIWTDEQISFLVDNVPIHTIQPSDLDGFWKLGDFDKSVPNPWMYSTNRKMAPFDQKFFIAIKVAVGGANGYFPDDCLNGEEGRKKPWVNSNTTGSSLTFYTAKNDWLPTWIGERGALVVDYVRVYAI